MLHTLPNELLLFVASTLATSDLASLILANRHLCSLLTPTITELARQDYRALHHPTIHGYHDVLQHLLSHDVPASIANGRQTALHEAVGLEDEIAVKLLLAHGASPEGAPAGVPQVVRLAVHTPLVIASLGASEEIVRVLLESGADPNEVGGGWWGRGYTPMAIVLSTRRPGRRSKGWEDRVSKMMVQYGALEGQPLFRRGAGAPEV